MKFCNIQRVAIEEWYKMDIVYRDVVMKKTYPNYYEISSKLSKLGNIMRVEILTLNLA